MSNIGLRVKHCYRNSITVSKALEIGSLDETEVDQFVELES